jgi:hypothetical protein
LAQAGQDRALGSVPKAWISVQVAVGKSKTYMSLSQREPCVFESYGIEYAY